MNRRIRELAIEADVWCDQNVKDDADYNAEWEQKFAELIVRECATMAESFHHHQYDFTGNLELHEFIKEHFGVE